MNYFIDSSITYIQMWTLHAHDISMNVLTAFGFQVSAHVEQWFLPCCPEASSEGLFIFFIFSKDLFIVF